MDVTSYLLGKQAGGGGGQPSLQNKSVTITENGTQNVTADAGYDGLGNVGITTNIQPALETKSVTITENTTTTITPTAGKDGLSSVSVITNVSGGGDNNAFIDMSLTRTSGNSIWSIVKKIDVLDTSNITNFSSFFVGGYKLEDVPILDTSKATNMYAMFQNCRALTDESLNNILDMCIGATDYTGLKELSHLGITSSYYPASRIQALPSYQDFLDAGWTIGY